MASPNLLQAFQAVHVQGRVPPNNGLQGAARGRALKPDVGRLPENDTIGA